MVVLVKANQIQRASAHILLVVVYIMFVIHVLHLYANAYMQ